MKLFDKKKAHQKGFTIIETVLMIVLLAIAIPPLLHLFAETAVTGAKASVLPTANVLAIELMEEIKATKFDELSAKSGSGNWSGSLGPDAGETATNKATFDDVDDFNGWTQNFGAGYPGYTAAVSVSYVVSSDLSTPLVIPSPMPNNWTPSYKLIRVTISNPAMPAGITLATVVTEVQSL